MKLNTFFKVYLSQVINFISSKITKNKLREVLIMWSGGNTGGHYTQLPYTVFPWEISLNDNKLKAPRNCGHTYQYGCDIKPL